MKNPIIGIHHKLQGVVPVEKRSKAFAFFLVLLGTSIDNLNVTGSITSFFSIYEYFGATSYTVSWTLSAYSLTLGAFILLAGKVTDMVGAHRVFYIAVSLMSLFALICAVITKSIITLIVFRAFQGIAASFLIPSAFAVAGSYFKGKQFMYALIALILALTGTFGLGLVLGGVFSATNVGYKGLYYLTFALGSTVSILLYFFMVPVERTEEHKKMKMKSLDIYGSAMFVIGLLLIILAFTESAESWKRPSVYVPLPLGLLIILAAFAFELLYISGYQDKINQKVADDRESAVDVDNLKKDETDESSYPADINMWRYKLQVLFPREALKVPNFVQFIIATPLLYVAMMAVMTVEVQYWLYVEHDTPLISGLKMFPLSVGFFIGTVTNRENIIYKISMKWVLVVTQALTIGLIVWISYHKFDDSKSYWVYEFVPIVLYGYLTSIYLGVYVNATLRRTPVYLQGVVSGLLQTASQVAICLGTAIVASLLGSVNIAYTYEEKVELKKRMGHAFYFTYAVLALAVVVMALLEDRKSVEDDPEEQGEEIKEQPKEIEDLPATNEDEATVISNDVTLEQVSLETTH
uniref:MFS transporter n=1 Tax=Cyberlindnera americana TaxID=36016 RepID=A0A5P8N8W2_9ASCO|nr:MFS transporter [Cyberlindnera americana]